MGLGARLSRHRNPAAKAANAARAGAPDRSEGFHDLAVEDRHQRQGDGHQQPGAEIVDGRASVAGAFGRVAPSAPPEAQSQEGGDDSQGDQEEEDAAPVDVLDDEPAQARADQKAAVVRRGHVSLHASPGLLGGRVHGQGAALGLHHGGADALENAVDDELQDVAGQAAQQRACGEEHDAPDVDGLASVHVSYAPEDKGQRRGGQLEGDQRPRDAHHVGLQAGGHGGQRDGEDAAGGPGREGDEQGGGQEQGVAAGCHLESWASGEVRNKTQ